VCSILEQYFDMTMLTTLSGCVLAVIIIIQNIKGITDYFSKLLFNKKLSTKYLTFICSELMYFLITYFNGGIHGGKEIMLCVLNGMIVSGIACKGTEAIMNKSKNGDSNNNNLDKNEISELIKNELDKVKNDKNNILKI